MSRAAICVAAVAALFVSTVAVAVTVGPSSEAQATTRAATPLTDAPAVGEYLNLDGLYGFRVCIHADSGQTLSGAGSLRAWVYDHGLSRWIANPGSDLTVSANSAGKRDACFNDQLVGVRVGRVFYATDGVTVSGGSVTVRITGWK